MITIRRDQLKIIDPKSPVLCEPLQEFDFSAHDPQDIKMLAEVLFRKMEELGGIGLSANQLGLPYRVFVLGVPEHHAAFFNPKIIQTHGEPETFKEGCLSYPGLFMHIKRPPAITVSYQNIEGEHRTRDYTGLTARVFQHEYDHMQGRDFTVGVSKLKLKIAQERYNKKKKQLIRQHALATMRKALEDGQKDSERV